LFSVDTLLIALGWILQCIEYLLFARAIFSIIFMLTQRQWKITNIIVFLTEPLLAPVRNILNRSEMIRNSPFDISFLVVFILVSSLRNMLIG
jgi:YggT family protein